MARQTSAQRSQFIISCSSHQLTCGFGIVLYILGVFAKKLYRFLNCIIFRNLKFLGNTELKGHINYVVVYKNVKNNAVDRIDEIEFVKFIMRYNKVTP